MKSLVLGLSLLVAGGAQAAYDPSDYNCSELQSVLAQNGSIAIKRLFGSATYTSTAQCNFSYEEARAHYEWAKDTSACQLGWDCVRTGN